jgi:hypothetical protein
MKPKVVVHKIKPGEYKEVNSDDFKFNIVFKGVERCFTFSRSKDERVFINLDENRIVVARSPRLKPEGFPTLV